jgi:RNA exonuclease 4
MANVFYTKKAKSQMRKRRRKQAKEGDNDNELKSSVNGGNRTSDHAPTLFVADDNRNRLHVNRKRPADQIISHDQQQIPSDVDKKAKLKQPPITTTTVVYIPTNLTPKEAKKFRKDTRRKARMEGQSEDAIKFIIEGQTSSEGSGSKDDKQSNGNNPNQDTNKNTKPKQSFPRINDLLSQHAAHQKLVDKLSKQKSINDSIPTIEKQKYIAIDCEMVGIGIDGKKSALARVSAVDYDGNILLDTHVRVPERVTDFRTHVSGVRPKDIASTNAKAVDHATIRSTVGLLLHNKILVGHALTNDLSVLMLSHPRKDMRDTARYKPFMRPSGRSGGKLRPRKLRDLVHEQLGTKIQEVGKAHDSVDDARASMELFKVVRVKWEKELNSIGLGVKKKMGGGGKRVE